MAYSVISTPVAGTTISTVNFGIKVKDNFDAAFPLGVDGWTSYTPTLTQSTTVTKTVNYARYQRVGRLITVQVDLTVTGAGTANNAIQVGLPVAAAVASGNRPIGNFYVADIGTSPFNWIGVAFAVTTTVVQGVGNQLADYFGKTSGGFPTLAAGDIVGLNLCYEAAS